MISSRAARTPRIIFAGWVAASSFLMGCATASRSPVVSSVSSNPSSSYGSPIPTEVSPGEAWRRAEALAASQPDRQVLVGRGSSMQPLYRDRTVLVVERMPIYALRPGMTVVFVGDSGFPVAHVLIRRESTGWIARGLANVRSDRVRVRFENYVGTVVAAFTPKPAWGSAGTALATAERSPEFPPSGRHGTAFFNPTGAGDQ